MFRLRKLRIIDKGVVIIDVNFFQEEKASDCSIFTSLILGENGVGKSFLLKAIADIFIYISNAKVYKRKPKYGYEQFSVEYMLNDSIYTVDRLSGTILKCKRNGLSIDINDLIIPPKVLAVAFMVNDKFRFAKREDNDRYVYLGVRQSTNSTYTSSILRNVIAGIIRTLKMGYFVELQQVLEMLGFEPNIELCDYHGEIIDTINIQNPIDLERRSDISENRVKILSFYKHGKRLSFEDCSSGEKHIIFAFMSILSAIEPNSLVLIDEPEISLHPEWQIKYISILKQVLQKFVGSHIILASHSHYFVADLKGESSAIVVLRHSQDCDSFAEAELIPYDTFAWSAENIIYNVFGLRTTRNYYFESDLQKLIQLMQEQDTSDKLEILIPLVDKLKKYVFDSKDPLNLVIDQAKEYIKCLQNV